MPFLQVSKIISYKKSASIISYINIVPSGTTELEIDDESSI